MTGGKQLVSIRYLDQFKLYENQSGLMSYAERAVRKAVNVLERSYCGRLELSTFEGGERRREDSVIVSMTTFPARISYVHLAIKSLLNQTVIPEKLILWLAKDQFRDIAIPEQLRALCAYGLEIRFCDEDLLAHKKYYYAMRTFPEQVIVTYDDDIIYPEDSLEKLLMMHRKFPDAIICNRGREIEMNGGFVTPYKDWKVSGRVPAGLPSYRVMASTGAGTLYPPHCMPEETFDVEKIRALALTADDLWMKVMSIHGGVPVVKTQTRCKALCISKGKQDITLAHQNVDQKLNDQVMKNLLTQYPQVLHTLLEDEGKYEQAIHL